MTAFQQFDLTSSLLSGLGKMGFRTPTDVQTQSIKPMMAGRDITVQAPTGSGKTCAFGIPVIEGVDPENDRIQTLILCPTRELATQTASVLRHLAAYKRGIRIMAIYGGESMEKQIKELKRRPQIVVATPGRLLDHMNRRTTRLDHLNLVVLDEADRMLDMGFRHDLNKILDAVPTERQTVMFSATMLPDIRKIAKTYQKDHQHINIEQETMTVDTVRQFHAMVEKKMKDSTLVRLIADEGFALSLVFVARKHRAKDVARTLNANGITAAALHGDMTQPQRDRAMARYRNGEVAVLVATDVAARGLDVKDIDAVINYDIPQDTEGYVHRIGRTGRADSTGVSYTFVMPDEVGQLRTITRVTNAHVPSVALRLAEGFISGKSAKAAAKLETAGAQSARPQATGSRPARSQSAGSQSRRQQPESSRARSERSQPARPQATGSRSRRRQPESSRARSERSQPARPQATGSRSRRQQPESAGSQSERLQSSRPQSAGSQAASACAMKEPRRERSRGRRSSQGRRRQAQ
ncbi:MAG: DEAD/DEAH box helicase [Clostridiales Family XIII bacterium]|jgi:ATP-dependent RNA helicase DeaD|nr:DEAD/DEAH box helicase [Clostridiales Family XIII bacterium]